MMYTNNRDAYRQTFFTVWQKHQKKLPLEPVESQLIAIILMHPEYHPLLENPDSYRDQEFAIEENPFIHMSLHLAVREQVRVNRPLSITEIYQSLLIKYVDAHEVEHKMMGCLGQIIWNAKRYGEEENEGDYLEKLKLL